MINSKIEKIIKIFFFVSFCTFCKSFDQSKNLKFKDPSKLRPELDICPWWNRAMTWEDFLEVRRKLERPELFVYVDKIKASEKLESEGYKVIPVIHASTEKEPFIDKLAAYSEFVAKPSHMSGSTGLIVYSKGKNLVNQKEMSLEDVQNTMFKILDTPSNSNEWYLQNMTKGFIVQEYIKDRLEIKFHTVWGRVVAITQGGSENMDWNWYTREGKPISYFSKKLPPPFLYPELREEGIKLAEQIAKRTDALRVDFLVKKHENGNKELLVNELELRSKTGGPEKESFIQLLNFGYEGMCI